VAFLGPDAEAAARVAAYVICIICIGVVSVDIVYNCVYYCMLYVYIHTCEGGGIEGRLLSREGQYVYVCMCVCVYVCI
jgi:hypothetical protein